MAGRVRHPIDVKALEEYISQNVPEIQVPLDVKQFGFGQSNPTYQITSKPTGRRYVLRKKPPGKLLSKTAHRVEREHRILTALGQHQSQLRVPVPRTHALCLDAAVIGTPFYIMQHLDGRIIEDPAMVYVPAATPPVSSADRALMWRSAVETLARLHRVAYRDIGLASYGQDAGFYDRQLATWRSICAAQAEAVDVESGRAVGQMPHFGELLAFFGDARRQPRDRGTLIHGDYKIDNLVYAHGSPEVIGILDWEMSTVGHPLSDLANLTNPWAFARMPASLSETHYAESSRAFVSGATPGLPTAEEVVRWYGQTAGWDVSAREMNWATAFSMFRAAAICQGIAARVARRQASSEQARRYAESFAPLAEYAWELVRREMTDGGGVGEDDREEKKEIVTAAKL